MTPDLRVPKSDLHVKRTPKQSVGRAYCAPLTLETSRPGGPDGEGQAKGQARNARRTSPSRRTQTLQIRPRGFWHERHVCITSATALTKT